MAARQASVPLVRVRAVLVPAVLLHRAAVVAQARLEAGRVLVRAQAGVVWVQGAVAQVPAGTALPVPPALRASALNQNSLEWAPAVRRFQSVLVTSAASLAVARSFPKSEGVGPVFAQFQLSTTGQCGCGLRAGC